MITFEINGRNVSVDADPDTPLLWVIREQLGLTGTKYGCGIAACGACTVHIDGSAVRSCSFPAGAVGGHAVTTIEGSRISARTRCRRHGLPSRCRNAATARAA